MLELFYNFFDKYCDVTKFAEIDKDTDSFYLTLSVHYLHDCIRPASKKEWNSPQNGDCRDEILANSTFNNKNVSSYLLR